MVPNEVFRCTCASDSGPDAKTSDNCRWPISAPSWLGPDDGRLLRLADPDGRDRVVSLEGGSDGLVPTTPPAPPVTIPAGASVFELSEAVDGILACSATTDTVPGDGTAPEVTVRRLDNANPAEPCAVIPYTLANGDLSARFLKPMTEQTSAQFVLDLVWTVPTGTSTQLPVTTVDFESADPRSGIPLGWCPDPVFDGDVLTGILNPLTNPAAADQDDVLGGKQFACVGSQTTRVVDGDPDVVEVAEQVYLMGDVLMRK